MSTPAPASLLGNAARMAPAPGESCPTPLFLDAVFEPGPAPTSIPYPFVPTAGNQNNAQLMAIEQAIMDFEGPVTYMANWRAGNKNADPPTDVLNAMASDSGVTFQWKGKTYSGSGPWTPVAP